ncbi:putative sodium/potassium/calcium exchanger [Orchesella cincta]|uniref:Putative sodium/potassium/calcium exchanger n=1 Tax=Orchesella cincta TaxID=48709 RepID=A0A1D2MLQ2_ORCCI|nr:putative sodium/potassium/calcium exchanger [Orchesella cincta]
MVLIHLHKMTGAIQEVGVSGCPPTPRVRKRRGRTSIFFVVAFFLIVTSLKSTRGGSSSASESSAGRGRGGDGEVETHHAQPQHNGHPATQQHPPPVSRDEGNGEEKEDLREGTTEEERSESTSEGKASTTTATDTQSSSPTTTESSEEKRNETESPEEEGFCVQPAIRQFPRPILSQNVRKHGGFLLYVSIAAYTFLALAIVCDEFFVPSLDILCELLKISPDVAGATFMAAGSSAPELATALIGVFVAKVSDVLVTGVLESL